MIDDIENERARRKENEWIKSIRFYLKISSGKIAHKLNPNGERGRERESMCWCVCGRMRKWKITMSTLNLNSLALCLNFNAPHCCATVSDTTLISIHNTHTHTHIQHGTMYASLTTDIHVNAFEFAKKAPLNKRR